MIEEVIRFGEKKLGFGMIVLPAGLANAPIVVCLNAGVIHREGPYRLNVLLCRALAEIGCISVRVDLSGKGDTPSREGLTNRESVALDWVSIKESLFARFGERKLVLMGLCSGADNAIKITAQDPNIEGLILLDAISPPDAGFSRRALWAKLTNIDKWLRLPRTLFRRFRMALGVERDKYQEMASLRDKPTVSDMDKCFQHISQYDGKVLAVFTSHAVDHYNQQGQFVRAINIAGLERCCQEIYWPLAEHLYPLQAHRDHLVSCIKEWVRAHLEHFRSGK